MSGVEIKGYRCDFEWWLAAGFAAEIAADCADADCAAYAHAYAAFAAYAAARVQDFSELSFHAVQRLA